MREGPTIANSSCLIALDAIGRLDILEQLYRSVAVPEAVAGECGLNPCNWMTVQAVQNDALAKSLRLHVGPGEAEAIALASELGAARVILDDRRARRMARQLGLPVTGTVGVVLRAKQAGIVQTVKPILDELLAAGFWMSQELIAEAVRIAGE